MAQAIDLERLANTTKHEQHLHLHWLTARPNGPDHIMQEAKVACPYVRYVRIAIHSSAVESLGIECILGSIEGFDASLRLHPDLAVLANVAEPVSLWVDNGNLSADWYHAGILYEECCRISVWVNWINKTPTKRSSVKPQLNWLNTHVRARSDHRVEDVRVYCINGCSVEARSGKM